MRVSRLPGPQTSEGVSKMLGAFFNSLPITLLVEGGIFLTLAVGVRWSRRFGK